VAFSPDDKTALTGSWDNTARLWRADSGAPVGSPLRHQGTVDAVAFSPDGKTVLTGSEDKTARLWRADNGAPIGSPLQHQDIVDKVAFSPDGKTVLTGSGGWLYLWRRDGAGITAARFLPGWIGDVHFLEPSGRRLKLAQLDTGSSVVIRSIDLDHGDSQLIQGDPRSLLSEWMRKLALTFDESGRIVPLYPVSATPNSKDAKAGRAGR
jgi:WD40 repeat protein